MKGPGRRVVIWICSTSARHPLAWLAAAALISVPALIGLRSIELDTDLTRLLPRTSRAAMATTELGPVVGGASYAVVLFEGDDQEQVRQAVKATAARIATLGDVASVEYELPVEFIEQYRFLLIPVYYLNQINNRLSGRPARPPQLPHAGGAVVTVDENGETFAQRQDRRDLDAQIREYSNLPRYHQSPDGRIMGILVRTARGVTSLGASRRLFRELETVAQDASREYGLWAGVTGSLRNKIDEFDVIVSDLGKSGVIAVTAILLTLLISFRSLRIIPVVLLPLGAGLLWAASLVPPIVGGLNLITSFLLIVMFGMGIDYAIHFVKRYQHERAAQDVPTALEVTFTSTGAAV
jgi:predicted RND superfamily exporter protein